jgi:hypothetical protein
MLSISKIVILIFKYLSNYIESDKLTDLVDLSIKILNKYCDYTNNELFKSNIQKEEIFLQNTSYTNLLKYFTPNNLIISVFIASGSLMVIYYFDTVYYNILLENIQQIHDKIWPPFVHKVNPQVVLVKASRNFLFYRQSDITRILDFRKKRFEKFLKEMKEKEALKALEEKEILKVLED